MEIKEKRLLQEMVNKIVNSLNSVDSVVMTVLYKDGIADTFSFGGENAGIRMEIRPLSKEEGE